MCGIRKGFEPSSYGVATVCVSLVALLHRISVKRDGTSVKAFAPSNMKVGRMKAEL